MKRMIFLLACFMVAACAGNPPAWWNPGNVYSEKQAPASQQTTVNKQAEPSGLPAEEQTLSLQDETYEEMILTPLQDEEGENDSGDASAQSLLPVEDENLLPPPSILAE